MDKDVRVPMRDGITLAADIYRPDTEGAFPVLYAVSPYQKDQDRLPDWPAFKFRETGDIEWWVRRGYVYARADVRGTGKSTDGEFRMYDEREQADLYDAIEWLAVQPWSSGRVGMIGESYYGAIQWLAAIQNPPHLTCIAPYDAFVDLYRDAAYHGGIVSSGFLTWWTFDTRTRQLLDTPGPHAPNVMGHDLIGDMLRQPTDGPFWWERSAYPHFDKIKVPFYSIGNWTNIGLHLRGNLLAFEQIDAPKKLLMNGTVAPGGEPARPDYPNQGIFAAESMHHELLRWYDHWLKGIDTGILDEPPVRIYVQPDAGYRSEAEWPVRRTRYTPLYLRRGPTRAVASLNDGALSWDPPARTEPPTRLSYPQPDWSYPGLGTAVPGKRGLPHQTKKIPTFTSPPLTEDIEVTGPIVLRLWASSDQRDTDFFVKISDQAPLSLVQRILVKRILDVAPPTRPVARGWLRASHRAQDPDRSTPQRPFHTHQDPQPLEPGEIYQFEIEVWPTSWLFRRGHRIRVELANGDSAVFDPLSHHYGIKMGTDTIYHDADHPTHLIVPVVPGA